MKTEKRKQGCLHVLVVIIFALFSVIMGIHPAHSQSVTVKIASYDPAFDLDMSTTNGQFASTNIKCQVFKRIVEDMTAGRIKVDIFPNAQLGGDREAFEMVKAGSLQMSGYPGGVLSGFAREVMAVAIPYLFKDINIAFKAIESKAGKELGDVVLKKTGVRILAWGFDGPYSNIMTLNKQIRVPNDLKGVKIRLPQDPLRVEAMKLAGGSPTPLSWTEVYTALQQGLVDGLATTLYSGTTIKAEKLIKYLNLANPFLAVSNIYINEKFYQSLSKDDQHLFIDASQKAARVYAGMQTWGEGLWVDVYRKSGVTVYFPSPSEMELWRKAFRDPTVKWVKDQIGSEWVDKFQRAAEEAEIELYGK